MGWQPRQRPSRTSGRSATVVILAGEVRGQRLARWSSTNKHTDLMQARAWYTRGLVAILLAGRAAATLTLTAKAKATYPPTTPTIHHVLEAGRLHLGTFWGRLSTGARSEQTTAHRCSRWRPGTEGACADARQSRSGAGSGRSAGR